MGAAASTVATPVMEAHEVELGPTGFTRDFNNRRGLRLTSYWWPNTTSRKPKGVMVLCHGHGAYIPFEWCNPVAVGRPKHYVDSWVQRWNQEGYSVCGVDYQSHGRSEGMDGLRCHIESFQELVDDVLDFVQVVRTSSDAAFGGLPLFGCGISLGGCVLVSAAHQMPGAFSGVVLLAPMLSLEKMKADPINALLRPLASLLAWLVPSLPIVAIPRNTMFPLIQDDIDQDPFMWSGGTRARTAVEYMNAVDMVRMEMPAMTFPFLCFHSRQDTMTDPEGSDQLYKESAASDKTLVNPEGMWHGLTREDGNQHVLQRIIEWTDARTAAAAQRLLGTQKRIP